MWRASRRVKNSWRKPWLCICWKRTFLHRFLILKSQQNRIELVTWPGRGQVGSHFKVLPSRRPFRSLCVGPTKEGRHWCGTAPSYHSQIRQRNWDQGQSSQHAGLPWGGGSNLPLHCLSSNTKRWSSMITYDMEVCLDLDLFVKSSSYPVHYQSFFEVG